MDATGTLLTSDEGLLMAIALARAQAVPIYAHKEQKIPATPVPGEIGWMEVTDFGWVRMIYNCGLGWMSYGEWSDHVTNDDPRISSNA